MSIKSVVKKLFSIENNAYVRNRWVEMKLKQIQNNSIILDAGCGTQQYKKYCTHLQYRAQDFGQYDGSGDNHGLQDFEWNYGKLDYIGDIWNINEKDSTFDTILCTEVLEHIPFPNETIKEFSRLLKKNGHLILTAPFCSIPHQTPYYFYNGFSKYWYERMANVYDFEIIEIVQNGNPTDYVLQELLRLTDNKLKQLFVRFMIPLIRKFLQVEDKSYLHYGYQVFMKKI